MFMRLYRHKHAHIKKVKRENEKKKEYIACKELDELLIYPYILSMLPNISIEVQRHYSFSY